MSKTYRVVSTLVVVAVVVAGAYYLYQRHRVRKAGVLTENIVRQGNQWNAEFTARIAAPEPKVFDSIRNFDKNHYDEIKSMQVISESDDQKVVEIQIAAIPGQVTTTRLGFRFYPDQHRITYRTLGGGPFSSEAEYDLTDEGAHTLIRFTDTTSVPNQIPVPDAIIKRFIRGYFVSQLQDLQKNLHVAESADSDSGDDNDEP
jgi:carbon monoxide dehydrogenase subunit G